MTWMTAALRALGIFFYFLVFTVVVPDLVIGLGAIAEASDIVRDLVVLSVWGAAFVVGVWGLRRLQARGLI